MPDHLFPSAIEPLLRTVVFGHPLSYRLEVDSTQEWGREAARGGAPSGAVFLTDHQTAGRGRLGRSWAAPPGSSVLTSILVRPTPDLYPQLFMVAALAVVMAIEETLGIPCSIKWPNDVLIKDKKVAGVLAEGEFVGETPDFAVVGIGINVNLDPAGLAPTRYPATSLSQEAGAPVSREGLLANLLLWFERLYTQAADGEAVHNLWRARLGILGRLVTIVSGDEPVQGIAAAVDSTGALTLTLTDGAQRVFVAGDVTLGA